MITVYAQNFEDVLLWRALGHVENGHYIDVGASDPYDDSVTRLFYEHGWRGINVEPVPDVYRRLVAARPDEINVLGACGAVEEDLTVYEVVGTGLSTLDGPHAQDLREQGHHVIEHVTPVLPLNSILAKNPLDQIHFLKVDVEGAEPQVLAGLDLTTWRPWIMVIEATAPQSQRLTSDAWEPGVLAGGYSLVYFDGLNNYYVADEHPELVASFAVPPNFFDEFVLPINHGRVSGEQVGALKRDLNEAKDELTKARRMLTHLETWAQVSEDWARSSEARLQHTISERDEARQRVRIAENAVKAMKRSRSWIITAPLRGFRMSVRDSEAPSSPGKLKAVARPVLNAGLYAVRRNTVVRRAVESALKQSPALRERLQSFANARPAPPEGHV